MEYFKFITRRVSITLACVLITINQSVQEKYPYIFFFLVIFFFSLSFFFFSWRLKIRNASRICVSSLRRGHANLLCIFPILVYVLPKRAPSFFIFCTHSQNSSTMPNIATTMFLKIKGNNRENVVLDWHAIFLQNLMKLSVPSRYVKYII